jgi:hypothetical protein
MTLSGKAATHNQWGNGYSAINFLLQSQAAHYAQVMVFLSGKKKGRKK